MPTPHDQDVLVAYAKETIGTPGPWPGGWPHDIEAALIDAVFSVRATYGSRVVGSETGVFGAVTRWRAHRDGHADDLHVLADTAPSVLAQKTNAGRIARRSKAEIVVEAANALKNVGVRNAADVLEKEEPARVAYRSVKGCGPVTWRYFRMLVGLDDVKPDTWVMRFVQDRLPHIHTTDEAALLIAGAAAELGVEAKQLDHAIWLYRRSRKAASAA